MAQTIVWEAPAIPHLRWVTRNEKRILQYAIAERKDYRETHVNLTLVSDQLVWMDVPMREERPEDELMRDEYYKAINSQIEQGKK